MNPKILITGSSGYIGSHFVKYFKQHGADVYGIDLHFPPKALQKYLSNHIVEDISSVDAVSHFLEKIKPDLIIHCAAKCLVGESVEKPQLYHEYNVTKASVFLDLCLKHGITNFLFSSSAATYGEPIESPIKETHPQSPINPYGESKKVFEHILLSKKEMCVGIFRYFNAAGADPENEIGEHHEPETHLIPNIIKAVLGNQPVPVMGNDYPTRDGTCIRDYIHVYDLAEIHWKLAMRMMEKNRGGIYNLGLKSGFSILEVIKTAEKILGKKAQISFLPRRPGDPSTLIADATLVQKDFDWHPKYSLEQIIDTAAKWHSHNA